jgi:flavodoxin
MKTLIIYKSIHHGNTKKIAEVMAEELGADLVELDQVGNYNLEDYDLIGFGSGIYAWRHHKALLKFVDELSNMSKNAFVFSTSGAGMNDILKNHRKLKEKLATKGFNLVGDFTCLGWDSFGPLKLVGGLNKNRPNEEDFQSARNFANSLKINS